MARADTWTLLCIDDWARYMAIHPDAWNQVTDCYLPYAGACERVWLQYGWLDQTSGRIIGPVSYTHLTLPTTERV